MSKVPMIKRNERHFLVVKQIDLILNQTYFRTFFWIALVKNCTHCLDSIYLMHECIAAGSPTIHINALTLVLKRL